MYPVKANFKNNHKNDLSCKFCAVGESDQQHQLKCAVLTKFIPELTNSDSKYEDIFGSADDQLKVVKLFKKITKQREILLEALT